MDRKNLIHERFNARVNQSSFEKKSEMICRDGRGSGFFGIPRINKTVNFVMAARVVSYPSDDEFSALMIRNDFRFTLSGKKLLEDVLFIEFHLENVLPLEHDDHIFL